LRLEKSGDGGNQAVERHESAILREGSVAFVVTKESMNFTNGYVGIMTAKSGGIAERGILITNTGHVDPGYKGTLRYVVINMGHEPFCLRVGDVIAKLMIIKLATPSKPDWSKMHDPISDPDMERLQTLGCDFLDIEQRAEKIAEQKAVEVTKKLLFEFGLPIFGLTVVLTLIVGVFGGILTLAANNMIH